MAWYLTTHIFSILVQLFGLGRMSEQEKAVEILLLRHQLDMLERKRQVALKPNRADKLILAVLARRLKQTAKRTTRQLKSSIRIFQPATVLKWHRELVRRKWTFQRRNKGGRPNIDPELARLIARLANENARWDMARLKESCSS